MNQIDTLSRVRTLAATRPVLIWGAGRAGLAAIRRLRDRGATLAGVIDSIPRTNQLEGLPVHPPAHVAELRDRGLTPFILIASMHADEISAQAEALGLSADADFATVPVFADHRPGFAGAAGPDFYDLLHELRGHALADMPAGAQTILSAGCSGSWYFDWVEEHYGRVDRHIGTEAFRPRPDVLPANVEWLARDAISVPEVRDGSIDLAFSGQNIEHLWPEQVAGFLLESHRVLRQGGWLVIDSPNREVTRDLFWNHPEHTIEYSVAEIRELLDLAGFADISMRGIWLCRDRGSLLALSPFEGEPADAAALRRRAALARTRPEASFLWWAEAKKSHAPRQDALIDALDRLFASHWPERLNRFVTDGPTRVDAEGRWAPLITGERGLVADGPVFPLRAGRSRLRFRARGHDVMTPCRVRIDVTRGHGGPYMLASKTIECAGDGLLELEVELSAEMTFHLQTQIFNAGGGPGEVLLACEHL
jgi:SAM-dependent methyltransferase